MRTVFTPLNSDQSKRLKFDFKDVRIVQDNGFDMRKLGYKATVLIEGELYKVFGLECEFEGCECDSYIVKIKK